MYKVKVPVFIKLQGELGVTPTGVLGSVRHSILSLEFSVIAWSNLGFSGTLVLRAIHGCSMKKGFSGQMSLGNIELKSETGFFIAELIRNFHVLMWVIIFLELIFSVAHIY